MTLRVYRSSHLRNTFYLTMVLAFLFEIYQTEGIRWINIPPNITKCAQETANLTWEYVKDETEDIRQFQWRFNSSTLIAYRGLGNGLHIDPKYLGRVEERGGTGILLKNITAKDIGSYSLYIVVAWKDTPAIRSIWLNVIDAEEVTIPQWCTCERLPVSQEWNGGRNFNVVNADCSLEVNSSHCCIREPVHRCKNNNPCILLRGPITRIESVTPIKNTNQLTENDTQNGFVAEGPQYKDTDVDRVLLITFSVTIAITFFISLALNVIFILLYCKKRTKKCQKAKLKNVGISKLEEDQGTPMIADIDSIEMQPYDENRLREEEVIKIIKNLLSQHKSHGTLEEMATSEHPSRASTRRNSQSNSDYSSLSENVKSYSGSVTNLSDDSTPISSKVRFARASTRTDSQKHSNFTNLLDDNTPISSKVRFARASKRTDSQKETKLLMMNV